MFELYIIINIDYVCDIAASSPNIPASISVVMECEQDQPDGSLTDRSLSPRSADTGEANQVVVPRVDDETFQAFYAGTNSTPVVLRQNKVKVSLDDFDHVFMESEDM